MLVLFETPAGYAIFKLLDEKKLQSIDNLFQEFSSADKASQLVKLKSFEKFGDTTEALAAATAAVEGKMTKSLKKQLKKVFASEAHEKLAVADAKLGNVIKEKMEIDCVANSTIQELMRCIREQADSLLEGLEKKELTACTLGLAHSLSRYKLKFSPDKVDTMIIQAISLLDDLDKELNNYTMRLREWFGWHFPEMGKIVTDNIAFAKVVKKMGFRTNAINMDFSDILPEEVEADLKRAAEISMGTEIADMDLLNIKHLCEEIVEMSDYRGQLYDYIQNRMMAIAPNLTILVGELVGARLISHAGSLMNLAKHPASTVQILGAEKALFRALKTKSDTPKYGLIYHASLIGQTGAKNKGKMSRMLAAKSSLATRVDALGEETNTTLGVEHRAKLEKTLRYLEEGGMRKISGTAKAQAKFEKYESKSEVKTYEPAADSTIPVKKEEPEEKEKKKKKRKIEEVEGGEGEAVKKAKTEESGLADSEGGAAEDSGEKKKKKKKKVKEEGGEVAAADTTAVKTDDEDAAPPKKKKKKKADADTSAAPTDESFAADVSSAADLSVDDPAKTEKKKKKKKAKDAA